MKANDLRIGNYIKRSNHKNWQESHWGDIVEIGYNEMYLISMEKTSEWYIPIEITEEWLLKLGFKKSIGKWGNDFHILEKDGFICMFTIEHWTDTKEDSKFKNHWHCKYQLNGNKLKFVHEVQNLFFSLTGEELVFSSTEP